MDSVDECGPKSWSRDKARVPTQSLEFPAKRSASDLSVDVGKCDFAGDKPLGKNQPTSLFPNSTGLRPRLSAIPAKCCLSRLTA